MNRQKTNLLFIAVFFLIIAAGIFFSYIMDFQMFSLTNNIREDSKDYSIQIENERKYNLGLQKAYSKSMTDKAASFKILDSLSQYRKDINNFDSDINYVKARIYFSHAQYDSTLIYNNLSRNFRKHTEKRNLILEAYAQFKLGNFTQIELSLKDCSQKYKSCLWELGNYYETQGLIEQAISEYESLYKVDSLQYNFAKFRITQLLNNKKPYKELVLEDDNHYREKFRIKPLFYRKF